MKNGARVGDDILASQTFEKGIYDCVVRAGTGISYHFAAVSHSLNDSMQLHRHAQSLLIRQRARLFDTNHDFQDVIRNGERQHARHQPTFLPAF
jgi:hypothetical protein